MTDHWDYVSPGLERVEPDAHFPHMVIGDRHASQSPILRREIPHHWYVDDRHPVWGFVNRDEASILYNSALQFKGQRALEVGCWMGWSACHLALGGVTLDVVDPLLSRDDVYNSVSQSLTSAGIRSHVNLVAGSSPQQVTELAATNPSPWSLIFIDGNHSRPAPLEDTKVSAPYAASDAMILFHDLIAPDVAEGLNYLRARGWNTRIYQTMQIMGVAWRGRVTPVHHIPDPKIDWRLPNHLHDHPVSGASLWVE